MAFMGIFLMYMIIILAVLGFCTTFGAILLLIAFFMKRSYKKNPEGKKRFYIPVKIFGFVFMAPLVLTIGFLIYSGVSVKIEQAGSLSYQVMNNDYKGAERLLKKGVDPDCTKDSNDKAENGERTLLGILCEEGFLDSYGKPVSPDKKDRKAELAMINLLLDYGADIEHRHYNDPPEYEWHTYEGPTSYYRYSDRCGSTPLLDAVYADRPDIAELLIKRGADINAEDFTGFNALNILADNLDDDSYELCKLLIDKGCDKYNITAYEQGNMFLLTRRDDVSTVRLQELLK